MMNGIICVDSRFGKGTRFYFDITIDYARETPMQHLDPDEMNRSERRPLYPFVNLTGRLSLKGKKTLVVDDSTIQRLALAEQLANWDMNVLEADTVSDALQILHNAYAAKKPVDLLVVDSSLKKEKGSELLDRIAEISEFAELSILYLVPLDNEEIHPSDTTIPRMQRTLSKPISCSTLYDAVMSLLFHHVVEQQAKTSSGIGDRQFDLLPNGQKINILVAEDNKVNQIVVVEMLKQANLAIDVAQDGLEAFECFTSGHYDLVLMDCQMPQADGYEATEMIREWEMQNEKSRTPVIALTANAISGDAQKCFDAGMDAYCSKPINPTVLFQTMERLLGIGKE